MQSANFPAISGGWLIFKVSSVLSHFYRHFIESKSQEGIFNCVWSKDNQWLRNLTSLYPLINHEHDSPTCVDRAFPNSLCSSALVQVVILPHTLGGKWGKWYYLRLIRWDMEAHRVRWRTQSPTKRATAKPKPILLTPIPFYFLLGHTSESRQGNPAWSLRAHRAV